MLVDSIRIVRAASSRTRLEGRVRYDDRPRRAETVWFDVPDALADGLDGATGNAFFAAMLPLATALEQGLEIDAPVDEPLLIGADAIRARWTRWYGTRADLPIVAPARPRPASGPSLRTAFFSGGVDSTFTAWRGAGRLDGAPRALDELLFVEGFDLGLRSTAGIEVALANAHEAARAIDLPLHAVRTNLRGTRWHEADWTLLAHGPCLAAVALALGDRYGEARIASSIAAVHGRENVAWGSHPEIDTRLSSWTLAVREDGFETDRMVKLRALARHPEAVRRLRVCWQTTTGANCGRCRKCLFARVMLDLLVGPEACPGLPRPPDLLALLRALPVRSGDERSDVGEIVREAQAVGWLDVVEAFAPALAGDPTVVDRVTLHRPRSLRPPWWRRIVGSGRRAPRSEAR